MCMNEEKILEKIRLKAIQRDFINGNAYKERLLITMSKCLFQNSNHLDDVEIDKKIEESLDYYEDLLKPKSIQA